MSIISPQEAAAELKRRRLARKDLAQYIDYVTDRPPPLHIQKLCEKAHECMERKILRLAVAMPPGHAKTVTLSHSLPAFYLSLFQDHCIIAATHTQDLARANGRRARNIIRSEEHRMLFPNVTVSDDSSAADAWETTAGGLYLGFGVGATVVGRRADCIIIDDPLRGMEDADSALVRDNLWRWYGADLYTRLKPNGIIIIVATRYNLDDLTGRLFAASKQKGGEKWDELIYPALAKENDALGRKMGEALWPTWMSRDDLLRVKAQAAMTPRMFAALYQQEPVAEDGNKIQRKWFKIWPYKDAPKIKMTLQSYDTAISKKDKSAYSVCLTWGIFDDEQGQPAMILLSRWRGRVEYPDLRKMAIRLHHNYLDDNIEAPNVQKEARHPDLIVIEDKATGLPLIADLRRAGIPAMPFPVTKYGDKDARLMLCQDVFENGRIWVPGAAPNYTLPRRWADEYIQSMISFPAAPSRDDVDATSQAILFMKQRGWVRNTDDPREPEYTRLGQQTQTYY